jgi:hypothetical protein
VLEQKIEKIVGVTVCLVAIIAGLAIALVSYGSVLPTAAYANSISTATNTTDAEGTARDTLISATMPIAVSVNSEITATPTSTIMPTTTDTPLPTNTSTVEPTATQTPIPTTHPTATPQIIASGYSEVCGPEIYSGIRHCTLGPYEILRVNPKHPDVRFETVLPLGFDRYGNYGECRDVHIPNTIDPEMSTGPGCHNGAGYPGERVAHMAGRYPGVVAAFNGDFFSPTYKFGPVGLTVKNGERFDGYFDDQNLREVRRSSLSISSDGDIRIGIVSLQELPFPDEPWTWVPDPEAYYNSIGGLPLLVKNGHPIDLHNRCILEEGWCPDQYYQRARTAFGRTFSGEAIVLVAAEEWGVTLETLSYLMVELGASEAINLDGGGSSQLWFAGDDLVYSTRPVAESMLVFSTLNSSNSEKYELID